MIDPVIFTIRFGNFEWSVHWYGVLVMLGVVVAAFISEREVRRRGEDGEHVWNLLLWLVPVGVIGARLWYVANATLGGNSYYLDRPLQIINIPDGGLHFFGGLLFGVIAIVIYTRHYKVDIWLILDAIAPTAFIGQAIARPANFINQELYGQPTTVPWGIPIDFLHRIPPYNNLDQFPESTRFHPTFAYEMIWNFIAAGFLLWLARRFRDRVKPGMIFAGWLLLAGIGRVFIEDFRPDQPRFAGTDISFTRVFSLLMGVAGLIMLLIQSGFIRLPFLKIWPGEYSLDSMPLADAEGEAPEKKPVRFEDIPKKRRNLHRRKKTSDGAAQKEK
ncbi:MAG: prolipoprotein diacylglyceryl transferase [Anaerolineales bacterium]|nr:prolipoprotein diacylglyceryl transferase [Anaerolineales bacterium]